MRIHWRRKDRPVDWLGQQIETESQRRIDRSTKTWWRRHRWELELTLWGGWAFLVACGLAGITFLLSAQLYSQEKKHASDQVLQQTRDIRRDLAALLRRTAPSERPKARPGGRRHEANPRLVPPRSDRD